ncbi:MAG TPA: aminotransferase class I/II-fold pyridoxal phosphate-dependent enzyme [Chitinophagaceae bacterium]|nr:aminotransferase class I/II-fold pyridoxal phosphate-dependent enzyme [Chitinophagaceae bacterium]
MDILNDKKVRQSFIKDFFEKNPGFNSNDHQILDHRPARRWFDLLKYGAEHDVYNFQEVIQGKSGADVIMRDHHVRMMSSYDYLGLIGHPEIEEAAIDAIRNYGTGTGGVRLLTGTNDLHCSLENAISKFKGVESTMVLSSGYLANLAAIAGLFGKNDLVLTDENIHRSIADAIKVAGVPQENFQHNQVSSLKELLEKYASVKRKLIIVEGIYSMDGDICPLPGILELKHKYNAFLMVDEAHSFGVLGKSGRGVNEHFGMDASGIDVFTGSLSKAIPTNGGFVSAKEEVIMYLKHGGAPYMFSAALSPANTAAAMRSLEIIHSEVWRLKRLWENTNQMKDGLRQAGVDIGNPASPVIPVICGDYKKAVKLSAELFKRRFLANSVIYPAVPINKARLRLCCTASHSVEVIDEFIAAVSELYPQL